MLDLGKFRRGREFSYLFVVTVELEAGLACYNNVNQVIIMKLFGVRDLCDRTLLVFYPQPQWRDIWSLLETLHQFGVEVLENRKSIPRGFIACYSAKDVG